MYETCDYKVWLVSSSIWYDFGRGPFSVIFRKNPLDPRNRGYFEGGLWHFCTNLRPQSSRTTPIFPRTERVLAESQATLRESCSPKMTKQANNILSGGQDRPLMRGHGVYITRVHHKDGDRDVVLASRTDSACSDSHTILAIGTMV